jgi:hypothetical protein
MKKIFLAVALFTAIPSFAQWHNHYHNYHGSHRSDWVAPVIGGVIGYEIARRQQVIIQQQPVIVQNPPVVYQLRENCTAWIETQNSDGTITRTRTCTQ